MCFQSSLPDVTGVSQGLRDETASHYRGVLPRSRCCIGGCLIQREGNERRSGDLWGKIEGAIGCTGGLQRVLIMPQVLANSPSGVQYLEVMITATQVLSSLRLDTSQAWQRPSSKFQGSQHVHQCCGCVKRARGRGFMVSFQGLENCKSSVRGGMGQGLRMVPS